MDPQVLARLTRIGFNKFNYEPSWQTIKAAYFAKYRGVGGVEGGVEDPDDAIDLDGFASPPGTSASHAAL